MKTKIQYTCEELGEQPVSKVVLKCGKRVNIVFVPINTHDTQQTIERKTAEALKVTSNGTLYTDLNTNPY